MVKILSTKILLYLFLLSSCTTVIDNILHKSSSPSHEYEREYHPNGKLQYETMYMNGNIDGYVKSWDLKGNLISKVEYVNGSLHGYWQTYYTNGKIEHSVLYKFGKKNGVEVWYHKNGNKKSEVTYVEDIIQSDIVRWDEEGRKIIK